MLAVGPACLADTAREGSREGSATVEVGCERACDTPPAATCSGTGDLIVYTGGSCVDGACDYRSIVADCEHGCDAGACLPAVQGQTAVEVCDDGDPCTVNDRTVNGECRGVALDCTLTSPPVCRGDGVERLVSNGCDAGRCTYDAEVTPCEVSCDKGACTGDPCATDSDCPAPTSPCSVSVCRDGACGSALSAATDCDDGFACTTGDYCVGGVCGGAVSSACGDQWDVIALEGSLVPPLTKLTMSVRDTVPRAETYRWHVRQPEGSTSLFIPSAAAANPTFEANVVGTYHFTVSMQDMFGVWSIATGVVVVTPSDSLHIELLWDTPGDIHQTDVGESAGADLDLHFVHPLAVGPDGDGDGEPDGFFDTAFDAYWLNRSPNWGSLDPSDDDDPHLVRDDTDGAGPEILTSNGSEDGVSYMMGAHYWHDHGYGESFATVRVYVAGVLAYEESDVELTNRDMWTVGTIAWPSGTVTPARVCQGTLEPCTTDVECATSCGRRVVGSYSPAFAEP